MKRIVTDDERKRMAKLGGTVALLRQKERMSIREFAKKAGLNHSDIFRLENGNTTNPSIFLIARLAKAFGLTVDELMNFNAKECPTCKGAGWVKTT